MQFIVFTDKVSGHFDLTVFIYECPSDFIHATYSAMWQSPSQPDRKSRNGREYVWCQPFAGP